MDAHFCLLLNYNIIVEHLETKSLREKQSFLPQGGCFNCGLHVTS